MNNRRYYKVSIKEPDQAHVRTLEKELGISNLVAKILVARGMTTAQEAYSFLNPRLEELSDPFLLPDIDKGAARVLKALKLKEPICIYGDYDADGVTSCALMVNFFRELGISPLIYIPERREGYGINIQALRILKERDVKLIIALDCGSTNNEEIKYAQELQMDVVVIDHHNIGNSLPEACAVINPKRKDSTFPTRELASCGVTLFFLLALRRKMMEAGQMAKTINLKKELDLVAIGTIGDMAPLVKDNRILVKSGMETMKRKPRLWLKSFYKSNLIPKGRMDEYTLNFIVIPRINAAGRVATPRIALDFLVCHDEALSKDLLQALNEANRERQGLEERILKEALDMIERDNLTLKNTLVLYKEGWHSGVIGIVAQKLLDRFGKPAIVITELEGLWKGSGRGGDGIDLYEAITPLSHLLIRFGGHQSACGILLSKEHLEAFKDAFEESVRNSITDTDRVHIVDAIADFEDLTKGLGELLEQLSPFGLGNPRPTLLFKPHRIEIKRNGFLVITDRNNKTWDGTIQADCTLPESSGFSIIASPSVKERMGNTFIHLNIKECIPVDNGILTQ